VPPAEYDIFSRLLGERIVFVSTAIDDAIANVTVANLLLLHRQDPRADVSVYVNSPGGSVTASLAIYDAMKSLQNDIATYAIGQAVGTAALLVAAGAKGKRFALPHARFAFVEPRGGKKGSASEIATEAEEIARLKQVIYGAFAEHTGRPIELIASQHAAGKHFDSKEALELGVIDKIIDRV
jgi:ATP-dependent Clp protease protease subunit